MTPNSSVFIYKVVVLFKTFSNDRSQAYIKRNLKWLWLQKYLKHMFPQGTWAFPQGKCIVPWGSYFFPRWIIKSLKKRSLSFFKDQFKLFFLENNHVPKEKELKLPHGTTMCPREQGFTLLGEITIPRKTNVFETLFDRNFWIWILIKVLVTTKL
jgi:hypothetical protein